MRAAVAFCVLALVGCTHQRGYVAIEPSAVADPDGYVLKPIAGFPAHGSDCEEMPDGSCELRPPLASTAPTSSTPRKIAPASRPKTLQMVAIGAPSQTIPMAASAPAQAPVSKPGENDRKTAGEVLTDAAIAALIIQASREAYYTAGHSCPCPYDLAQNGRLCAHQSAHSRPSGASIRCYATDVTADQIADYRARLASK
jgi:hypothetical protein